jgi:putative transposase
MKLAVESRLHAPVNKKRIARIQREQSLQAQIRRMRFRYPLINLRQEKPKANLLKRAFTADAPDRTWLTDITYIPTDTGQLYLSAVLDVFNREIVAHRISENLGLPFVLETFGDAFRKREAPGVLVHSDQGPHYTSHAYCSFLREHKAVQSMSRRGVCLDNAAMENFFGHLKSELSTRGAYRTMGEAKVRIDDYIWFYNNERIQEKLKMAPVAFRSLFEDT